MRAASPALCAGRRRSIPRNKSPAVPVLLLRDMDLCYRLLRQLVPSLPAGRAASRVEILQHVIDYILDLQTELDSSWPAGARGEQRGEESSCDRQQQRLQRPQSGQKTPGATSPPASPMISTEKTRRTKRDELCCSEEHRPDCF